jgi:hypothetical protein
LEEINVLVSRILASTVMGSELETQITNGVLHFLKQTTGEF